MGLAGITGFDVNPENGCVRAIRHEGGTIPIECWGCEFGNWHGYFSQAQVGGNITAIAGKRINISARGVESEFDVAMSGGHFVFEGKEWIDGGRLLRRYVLRAVERSTVGDFVIRVGLSEDRWPEAEIGRKQLRHRSKNKMVQIPESTALARNSEWELRFQTLECRFPSTLDKLLYIRDEPTGLWIIHHRLLTRNGDCDEYVLRVRHNVWSSYRHAFVKWSLLRTLLWRFAEKYHFRIPTILAGGNIEMQAGDELVMNACMWLESRV